MKFSSMIAERFKKILLLSLGAAITGLIVYGVVWTLHTRDLSKDFILSHLKEVIIAEVHSQNTFNIDGELNRIVDSWSRTQEFPIRVDAYLDGKHWAHGGPLKPFGFFSASETHTENLMTGQKLDLEINMDLSGPILRLLIALTLFVGFFVGVYFSLKRGLLNAVAEISKPLEERVNTLGLAASDLSSHARKGFTASESQVDELQKLDTSLNKLFNRITGLENEIAEQKYSEGQFQMAKQVTHALNGTLSAFSLYIDRSTSTDTVDKKFLKGIVRQITSISNDLMNPATQESLIPKTVNVVESVRNVIEHKSQEVQKLNTKNISIDLCLRTQDQITISGSKAKFELALMNLITNSIEAISADGQIAVEVSQKNNIVIVIVRDSGCGIPSHILPQLMREGATFGKSNGHGIGLFHVKSIIDSMSGTIVIKSREEVGTEIKLEIPLLSVAEQRNDIPLQLFRNQQLVIVDDEKIIHQTWDIKLKGISDKVQVIHLHSVDEFENWILRNSAKPFSSRLFLFDYDLKDHMNGLEIIERHHLMFESLLITGMANDEKVIQESTRLKVKTISKGELPNLHLSLEEDQTSSQELRLLEAT